MPFTRDDAGRALLGGVHLRSLLDDELVDSPFYAYDVDAVVSSALALSEGFADREHLICYAVKANCAGRILRRLAEHGVGADVVSGGELELCLAAGIAPGRIVFNGVGKTVRELDLAIGAGDRGILSIHAESIEELPRIAARAKTLGRRARVSLRINPSIEADTHAHIATGHDEAKFGVPLKEAGEAIAMALTTPELSLVGLSAHVGSQLTETRAYVESAKVLGELARSVFAHGKTLELLDLGGGFGIDYGTGCPVTPADFVREATAALDAAGLPRIRLLCEPGRSLVASFGVLVARTIQVKRWRRPDTAGWLMIDAGMNDLIRPMLYGARHLIEPLDLPARNTAWRNWRLAGPVCESTDDFGTYSLPDPIPDAVVIRDAGAYAYSMASQYNGRRLPIEAFIESGRVSSVSTTGDVSAWVKARLTT